MIFALICVILFILYTCLCSVRDRLTFWKYIECDMQPRMPYEIIHLQVEELQCTEGWILYGPTYDNSNDTLTMICLSGLASKGFRLELADDLFSLHPNARLVIYDYYGIGKTKAQYRRSWKLTHAFLDQVRKDVAKFQNKVWILQCVGLVYFLKNLARQNHVGMSTIGNDRILVLNGLSDFYISGVDKLANYPFLFSLARTIFPRSMLKEMNVEEELDEIRRRNIRILAVHSVCNRHVSIQNGRTIEKHIGSENYIEVAKMRHTRLTLHEPLQRKKVINFLES